MTKKILIIGMNYIGDTLFTTPLIKALYDFYDKPIIDIVNGERGIDILKNNPYIHKVIINKKDKKEQLDLINSLKIEKYDIGYAATPAFYAAHYLYKANIKIRVGVDSEMRGFFLTHKTKFLKHKMHIVDSILSPLKTLGIENYSSSLELFLSEEEENFGKNNMDNLKEALFIHSGATRFSKRYPTELFAKVLDTFYEKTNKPIILIGSNEDIKLSEEIKLNLENKKIISKDFTGKLSIREMIASLKFGSSFIGGDSAPLHIANALSLNTLGIYGDTLPLIYGTRGEKAINVSGREHCKALKSYYCEHFKRGCKTIECLKNTNYNHLADILIEFYK